MTYAFFFDASACSGCKACQEACKDKNNLPAGVLWRRVVEVSGGQWRSAGRAWENTVFAYSLSIACNHCSYPKCAGVCPVDAFTVRPDGIVLLDSSKCMGCGYCAWACPYGAPQYDAQQGVMAKCNFCADYLDGNLLPACVAACPMRALDLQTLETWSPEKGQQALWRVPSSEYPFPFPKDTHTEPHLVIQPHRSMNSSLEKTVSNHEEIHPRHTGKVLKNPLFDEFPLVVFTLLIQMAVGMSIGLLALPQRPLFILVNVGVLYGLAGLASFLHLGRKRNAWRALAHLRKSWLSRETLLVGFFGAAWVLTAGMDWFGRDSWAPWLLAAVGGALIYSMTRIYQLKTIPAWNSRRTTLSFFLTALILGGLGIYTSIPAPSLVGLAGTGLLVELIQALRDRSFTVELPRKIRIGVVGAAILGCMIMLLFPSANGIWLRVLLFFLAIEAEGIERAGFYFLPLKNRL